jgi:ribosomal protein S18 acetylase RimI-like enzyme
MEILADGREALAALDIDQWQNGYPYQETIARDVELRESYVVEDNDGRLHATAMIGFKEENDYLLIEEGEWLTDSVPGKPAYAVVHRVAVARESRGRGLAAFVLREAEKLALSAGCQSVRIDTHPGNTPMLGLLKKQGYTRCGIIYISHAGESTPERIAYEKLLASSAR